MKKTFVRAGVVSAAATAALALPAAAGATGPDGQYCYSSSPSGSCTTSPWTADVQGSFAGVTSGSWEVDQQVTVNGVTSWQKVAGGGAGPFAGTPGELAAGSGVYRLVITGAGGGAIGNASGGVGPA
jgi:hypothetical protein